MLVHEDVKPHTAIGNGTPPPPPPQFQGAMHELEPHMPPLSMEPFHPHLAAPHYLSFTARFSSPSHFKCTIPVTIHCKFKRPMVTHQNHHPPLITASECSSRTMQVNYFHTASSGATSWGMMLVEMPMLYCAYTCPSPNTTNGTIRPPAHYLSFTEC